MNRIRQQQITQQSSAAEIAAMQQEMQMLQQKIADSNQAKLQLQNEIEQVKSQKDSIIKMQDSVVGGDVVTSGGQKIETQTNVIGTDPEAIARIIFEAQERATLAERQRVLDGIGSIDEEYEDEPTSGKKGTVKWWNFTKGYGFIEHEDGDDIFVHESGVSGEITDGDTVSFDIGDGPKGPIAVNVRKMN